MAGIMMMLMTIGQILLFGPLAASFVDTYGARKILFAYTSFFSLWSLFWIASYLVDDMIGKSILVILMTICFSAGFGCKFVDVYTLRTAPKLKIGVSFGILVTMAGLGRFLGTLLQPNLIQESMQIYAPIALGIAMIIFASVLYFVRSDLQPSWFGTTNSESINSHIKTSLVGVLWNYGNTFYRGWRFIKRCRHFPLIPLTISFFEGMYFWSLYFIFPLFLIANPWVSVTGLEIGIYELISIFVAVWFGHLADKGKSMRKIFLGWTGVFIGAGILYHNPSINNLVIVWLFIWLSNSLLYATGQYILAKNDVDHENDGAYAQTRSIIANIGYMFMPVMRWLLIHLDFTLLLRLFASMITVIAVFGTIVAFYLLVMREKEEKRLAPYTKFFTWKRI